MTRKYEYYNAHMVAVVVTWWCFKTVGAPLFWWLPATRWVTLRPKEPPGSRWGHVPSLAEQVCIQGLLSKGLVPSLQTGTTWRTIPALELTSLRPRCWPGPVTCSSACSCFLHSPLSLIPRPPPNNLMPANLHLITSFPGNLACLCH